MVDGRMNGHAGRLIDHKDILVFIDHIQIYVNRYDLQGGVGLLIRKLNR